MSITFQADTKVEEIAKAYSLDAIDAAQRNFRVALDWSEESVRQVEAILATLHDSLASTHPTAETIWTFAKTFGSYVGEVYRRHHGGTGGVVEMDGQKMPGIQSGTTFWPWVRARKRITAGPEENIWNYYQALVGRDV